LLCKADKVAGETIFEKQMVSAIIKNHQNNFGVVSAKASFV